MMSASRETSVTMQRLPCVSDEHHLQDHLLSKHITLTWWGLSPRRPEQWMCRGFSCVTNVWPVQDQPLSKGYLLKGSVSRETWTMNMKTLPQCHWETAVSRPSFWVKLSYWLIEDLSPRIPEQWMYKFSCAFFDCLLQIMPPTHLMT